MRTPRSGCRAAGPHWLKAHPWAALRANLARARAARGPHDAGLQSLLLLHRVGYAVRLEGRLPRGKNAALPVAGARLRPARLSAGAWRRWRSAKAQQRLLRLPQVGVCLDLARRRLGRQAAAAALVGPGLHGPLADAARQAGRH